MILIKSAPGAPPSSRSVLSSNGYDYFCCKQVTRNKLGKDSEPIQNINDKVVLRIEIGLKSDPNRQENDSSFWVQAKFLIGWIWIGKSQKSILPNFGFPIFAVKLECL